MYIDFIDNQFTYIYVYIHAHALVYVCKYMCIYIYT